MGDSSPAPSTVTLPPTFANSFWSADYRTGITSLFSALSTSITQSDELIHHVQRRATLEQDISKALCPPALKRDGFGADDGGSLRMGFEAILTSEVGEARARQALSEDLQRTIIAPFTSWSASHSSRISTSRTTLLSHLSAWEAQKTLVEKLKTSYDEACRVADSVEDEVNFSRARRDAEGERGEKGRGGLPLRPEEIDDAALAARAEEEKLALRKGSEKDDEERSEDGLPAVDSEEEDGDDKPLAGVVSALGRAFSVRRGAPAKTSSPAASSPTTATAADAEKAHKEHEEKEKEKEHAQLVVNVQQGVEGAKEGLKKFVESEEVKKGVEWSRTKFTSLLSRAPPLLASLGGAQISGTAEERVSRTRTVADEAEEKYRVEVGKLDGLRLTLESTLSLHLPYLQRCETDRLRAATSVLKSYHAAVGVLPSGVKDSWERVGKTLEVVRGERDTRGVIERGRTGPFSPRPIIFTSHYAEPPLTTFGIDLRKYDETNPASSSPSSSASTPSVSSLSEKGKQTEVGGEKIVPPILSFLLRWIREEGAKVSEEERRKAWLYETPLSAQHRLRFLLLSPSTISLPYDSLAALLSRPHPDLVPSTAAPSSSSSSSVAAGCGAEATGIVDLPVACSTVKLWLLELEVPVITWERYDELKALFPARVGAETEDVSVEEVAKVVGKLPKVHLEVLKLLLTHLTPLLSSAPSSPTSASSSASPALYLQKLSLSLSRPLLRPRLDTALTLTDRFPSLALSFLLRHAGEVLERAEERKEREREERYRPRRQRTKPVDLRATRTNLGMGGGGGGSVDSSAGGEGGGRKAPLVPALPASAAGGGAGEKNLEEEEKPASSPAQSPSLLVNTGLAAPSSSSSGGAEFAASPLGAEAHELPPRSTAPTTPSAPAEEEKQEYEEAEELPLPPPVPTVAPSAPGATESPFIPPTEAAFLPPSSSPLLPSSTTPSVSPLLPSSPSTSTTPASHLKRSSISSTAPRMRGARAPRPVSQGSVGALAARFEGGAGAAGGKAGEEGGKRESWARTKGGFGSGVREGSEERERRWTALVREGREEKEGGEEGGREG